MAFLRLVFEKRPIISGETPELFFERLKGEDSFLLESGKYGRYSYIGYDPFLVCSTRKGVTRLEKRRDFLEWRKNPGEQIVDGPPLKVLRHIFKSVDFKGRPPVPFFAGAAGYVSYDFGVAMMGIEQKVYDDLQLPDFRFCFVDKVIAFDHETREVYFLAVGETDLQAQEKINLMKHDLQKPAALKVSGEVGKLKSNLTFAQYKKKIASIRKLLLDGETYQVNFSQRFSADCTLDSWQIYKKMFALNPSPFSCYFAFPDFSLMSTSPELLLRKRDKNVETRPIKGTIGRGKITNYELRITNYPTELNGRRARVPEVLDFEQIKTLLASKKDKAELEMIVDLERNDFGKVCEVGTVRLVTHRDIEIYSHVIHTVSGVEGILAYGKDFFDAFEAVFPGGSITGCPKYRTVELIDQLEDFRRGIYCGSAGFINFAGDGDLNILIRTMLKKNGKIYFQVGGGIVADSDSRKEYQETLDKAEALKGILEF